MKAHRRYFIISFLVVFSILALSACVRTLPGGSSDGTTAVDSGDESIAPANEDSSASDGSDAATTTEQSEPAATEEGTPRDEATDSGDATSSGETSNTETGNSDSGEAASDASSEKDTSAPATETEETGEKSAETTTTTEESTDEGNAGETTTETPGAEVTDLPATHTVAVGENLYRIGLKYGISWVTLANANNLANPNQVVVGQVLKIPGGGKGDNSTVEATPSPLTETTYTVKNGDNLYRIGLKYGITWVQIAEANGIVNPNQISVGDVLKIPVDAPGPAPQFTHEVKTGETLFLISLQYGVIWTKIAEANDLNSPYVIYPGQSLVIPGG